MLNIRSLSVRLSIAVVLTIIFSLIFTLIDKFYFDFKMVEYIIYAISLLLLVTIIVIYIFQKFFSLIDLVKQIRDINQYSANFVKPKDKYLEILYLSDGINRLITYLKEAQSKLDSLNKNLLKNKKELQDSQRIAKMASWTFYIRSKKIEASKEFYRMLELNLKKDDLNLKLLMDSVHKDDKAHFFKIIKRSIKNGSTFDYVHRVVTKRGKVKYIHTVGKTKKKRGKESIVVGVSLDVTEEMRAKMEAEYMAFHDPLTNLLNRRAFLEKMDFLVKLFKRSGGSFAVIFMDLDNFKTINDTYGHEVGDELLIAIAQILNRSIRDSDLIARMGGDEFVMVVTDVKSMDNVKIVTDRILNSVCKEFKIKGNRFNITVSLGVALFPAHTDDSETLFKYADAAMCEAKRLGKNRYKIFNDIIKTQFDETLTIVKDLEKALDHENEIVLYFQPQIDLKSGSVRGAEVLSRWNHPKKGLLFPGSYIPIVENTPLMLKYDNYILEKSFKQLYEWQKSGKYWTLSVNLSAMQFNNNELTCKLKKLLKKYPIDPSFMDLEITESIEMDDINKSIMVLQHIKSMGFKISIDDFGTGYSSLSYLKRLPFDLIKIDREFIKDMHQHDDDIVVVKLIIQIAKTLEKEVVAEGPDLKDHIDILKSLDCDFVQGFYYSKAITKNEFEEFVKSF